MCYLQSSEFLVGSKCLIVGLFEFLDAMKIKGLMTHIHSNNLHKILTLFTSHPQIQSENHASNKDKMAGNAKLALNQGE